jgi:hypothetical protein
VEAANRQVTLDRLVGGDPSVLAFSGNAIWVVNGFGDGKTIQADANTVVQLDPSTGDEVHRYSLEAPFGVAARGDQAWVVSASPGDMTTLTLLNGQAGTASAAAMLAGSNAAGHPVLVANQDAEFLVTRVSPADEPGRNTVYRLDANGQAIAQVDLPTFGNTTVAYADGALFASVANVQAGGVYRMDASNLNFTHTVSAAGAASLSTANGHLWVLSLDGSWVQAFDTTTARPVSAPIHLPGTGTLLAADTQEVWVAEQVGESADLALISPS